MPLTFQESKKLLVDMFRMVIATAERRSEDAASVFSHIIDATFNPVEPRMPGLFTQSFFANQEDDAISSVSDCDSMPPLVPLNQACDDGVKLIITETEKSQMPDLPTTSPASVVVNEMDVVTDDDDDEEVAKDEEEVAEDELADDEEELAEDEEEVVEEEAEELQLVPVRIKKVTYWKDEVSGDIYQYLPDDECGDKVGSYVDGKAVFSS